MSTQWYPKHVQREMDFGHPVKKGDTGMGVKRVQEWLTYHRCAARIDGEFGDATEHCVASFQQAKNLSPTGIVDQATWTELTVPLAAALAPVPVEPGETFPQVVLKCARQHLALHPLELGGDNLGVWVRTYMDGNEGREWKWCAGFVTFMLKQACASLGCSSPLPGSFSCDSLAYQAMKEGCFVPGKNIGDGLTGWNDLGAAQIFLCRRTSTDWTHTGLAFEGNGKVFQTIEGNTNDEGSSNGYEVCRRTRSIEDKDFIVLL